MNFVYDIFCAQRVRRDLGWPVNIYAFELLMEFCDILEYHQITKEEYEMVDRWIMDDRKVMEILRRPIHNHTSYLFH